MVTVAQPAVLMYFDLYTTVLLLTESSFYQQRMRLNLPGNTGRTPATYVQEFRKTATTKTYHARYVEANVWRQAKETANTRHKNKRAQAWLTKHGI